MAPRRCGSWPLASFLSGSGTTVTRAAAAAGSTLPSPSSSQLLDDLGCSGVMNRLPSPSCHLGALGCCGVMKRQLFGASSASLPMCEAAGGRGEGAVVFHGRLLLEGLEDKGDEAIHVCSHGSMVQHQQMCVLRCLTLEQVKECPLIRNSVLFEVGPVLPLNQFSVTY
jgi:hypothetical protein